MVCCFQTFLLFVFRRRGTPAWCEVSIALFSHGDEDEDEVGDDDERDFSPQNVYSLVKIEKGQYYEHNKKDAWDEDFHNYVYCAEK